MWLSPQVHHRLGCEVREPRCAIPVWGADQAAAGGGWHHAGCRVCIGDRLIRDPRAEAYVLAAGSLSASLAPTWLARPATPDNVPYSGASVVGGLYLNRSGRTDAARAARFRSFRTRSLTRLPLRRAGPQPAGSAPAGSVNTGSNNRVRPEVRDLTLCVSQGAEDCIRVLAHLGWANADRTWGLRQEHRDAGQRDCGRR